MALLMHDFETNNLNIPLQISFCFFDLRFFTLLDISGTYFESQHFRHIQPILSSHMFHEFKCMHSRRFFDYSPIPKKSTINYNENQLF